MNSDHHLMQQNAPSSKHTVFHLCEGTPTSVLPMMYSSALSSDANYGGIFLLDLSNRNAAAMLTATTAAFVSAPANAKLLNMVKFNTLLLLLTCVANGPLSNSSRVSSLITT